MLFQKRMLLLLALVVFSIFAARLGRPDLGMWDGPLGG
jgi:hypothetical protein